MEHVYMDRTAADTVLQPEGDYLVTITKAETAYDKGREKIDLVLSFGNGGRMYDSLWFTEAAGWRVDTFIKALGIRVSKGTRTYLIPERMVGWQYWCQVGVDTYTKADHSEGKKNKVMRLLCDRPLPPGPAPDVLTPPSVTAKATPPAPAWDDNAAVGVADDLPF